jgi:hypothetical protein
VYRQSATFRLAVLVTLLALGCAENELPESNTQASFKLDEPSAIGSLDDLSTNATAILRQLPGVVEVKRSGTSEKPTHRIVHLLDWHFVDRDDYAADLRSLSDGPLSDEEIDSRFSDLLDEVELVQEQQLAVLRSLIKLHGLKRIHVEGLTEQDKFIFDAKISALRKVGQQLADLRKDNSELLADKEPDAETKKIIDGIEQVEQQYRRNLLQIGAAGKLLLSGELESVLPLEDAEAYAAANPVDEDGAVTLDQKKIKTRQDGQVRLLLDNGPFAVIVLGGAHDLSDNVNRLSGGKAEYIRVEVEAWKKFAGEIGPK